MNDEPSPRGALAESPYVFDGPRRPALGCGDDHRSLDVRGITGAGSVGKTDFISKASWPDSLPPDNCRELRERCLLHFGWIASVIPVKEWKDPGMRRIAEILGIK